MHVTQKTGGVVALVHTDAEFILLKIRRNGRTYAEVPRGFREKSDANGFDAAAREVSEELGIDPADYGAHYRSLGIVIPDSNLLTTNIMVVDVAFDRLPQFPEIELQVDEGIEEYRVLSLEALQGMVGSGEIVDGFTIAAVGKYVGRLV